MTIKEIIKEIIGTIEGWFSLTITQRQNGKMEESRAIEEFKKERAKQEAKAEQEADETLKEIFGDKFTQEGEKENV